MTKVTVWFAYNTEGDCEADFNSAGDALQALLDNHGQGDGTRVIEMNLELPEIKPLAVTATIPETDGPVTVSVNS